MVNDTDGAKQNDKYDSMSRKPFLANIESQIRLLSSGAHGQTRRFKLRTVRGVGHVFKWYK